ncbi:MAG: 16S rRNA (guanine(527)-N(7))-methyltransferase RsmG [Spirochaetes bacterium]|nr:16S rRNA (guanine(527)-N(7))-methyltransferase RsmG [Spirochaetota bacterium]
MSVIEEDQKLLESIILLATGRKYLVNPISKYFNFLISKNKELNLISRKLDTKTIIIDHIYDCLVGWRFFKEYSSITDIGSGAGLPGLILAILFPEKEISLVEKSHKKTIFLQEAVKFIPLKNVTIFNELVNEHKVNTEVLTCRAFKEIHAILSMTVDFFENNGKYILYKGKNLKIDEEIENAKKKFNISVSINRIEEIKEKERHIVIIQKAAPMV